MNGAEIHLALTHLPVILSLVGLFVLVIAMIRKNEVLTKTAFYFLLSAGIFAVPVYFTGESAEEIIEHLPGVSESIIEEHEEIAKLAFGAVSVTGIVSFIGLLLYRRLNMRRFMGILILLLALVTGGVMVVTAHLGGQIRHTETGSDFTIQKEKDE